MFCHLDDPVPDAIESGLVDESFVRCNGRLGHLGNGERRKTADDRVHRECDPDDAVHGMVMWTFDVEKGVVWKSTKLGLIFSVSIEMLQLLLRLGTFQVSDIVYNTLGGMLGGLCYIVGKKVHERLSK